MVFYGVAFLQRLADAMRNSDYPKIQEESQ